LTDKKNGKIKYAVLHLFSGTLLILKERIRQEHWSLLFQKVDSASLEKFESGDFEGINFERVLHVLKEIAQLKLESEDIKGLNDVRKIRNKVEHFEYSISIDQFRPLAGKVLNFTIRFFEVHLQDTELSTAENDIFQDLKSTAKDFREYVDERLKVVEKYATENKYDVFHCTECRELSLVKEPDDFKCLVCGLEGVDTEDVVEAHLENKLDIFTYDVIKDGAELPQHDCPECGENTLVPEDKTYKWFICINCSERIDTKYMHGCSSCGVSFYDKDEETTICQNCWDYKFSNDD
jgi:hypothetical protein